MKSLRPPSRLSDSLLRQLNLYALAASATAGAGLLAATQSAEAKVIYTPAHFVLSGDGQHKFYFTNDGFPDFVMGNWISCEDSDCSDRLSVVSINSRRNGVVGYSTSGHNHFAYALKEGAKIGEPGQNFCTAAVPANLVFAGKGKWYGTKDRYLGLKFVVKHETYYGWIRVSVHGRVGFLKATVTGYAYQTIPNHPIAAGYEGNDGPRPPRVAPGSLGQLAAGKQ
jgi:hypothetical protein